ncbi:MAG TPA: hypothetical protein DIC19_05695 [Erysipelotrichaceae bacterium]|nr:hypothetical protein [Erysipelotrichaceae bacterium]
MKKIIVGYTGFVGSNLSNQTHFDDFFNSKNITQAFGSNPDLCVYAGLSAEKYIANANPLDDLSKVHEAIENIQRINPKFLILISTIDVYPLTQDKDETYDIPLTGKETYGRNRLILEKWVEENIREYLIVRLPALFGNGLKKNFIYDYIHRTPKMIKVQKFKELCPLNSDLEKYYTKNDSGFYQLKDLNKIEIDQLSLALDKVGFTSLNFTDSRNQFQFYNLEHLWKHIQIALKNDIKKINLVSEPISAETIFKHLENSEFTNHILHEPIRYDLKTIYYSLYNGEKGYIFTSKSVLEEINEFTRGEE